MNSLIPVDRLNIDQLRVFRVSLVLQRFSEVIAQLEGLLQRQGTFLILVLVYDQITCESPHLNSLVEEPWLFGRVKFSLQGF
jgi:hypothetical protein